MFCPYCGAHSADSSRFCTKCGRALTGTAAPAAPAVRYQPAPNPLTAGLAEKTLLALRKLGASPLFLVICICFSVMQLLSLLTIGTVNTGDTEAIYDLLRQLGMSRSEINDLLSGINGASGFSSFMGMIPGFLIMSGLWMVYGTCVNKSSPVGTAGLTMILVITILQLVGIGLVLLILLFASIAAVIASNAMGGYGEVAAAAQIASIIIFVVVAGITAFVLVYYIKIFTTISKIKATIRTGVPNRKISGFVAVMCFIAGGFSAIGSLISLAALSIMPSNLISVLITLLSSTVAILIGVLIFLYKSKMAQLEREMNPPAVPVRAAAPAYAAPAAPAVRAPVAPVAPAAPVTPAPVAEPAAEPIVAEIAQAVEEIAEAPVAEAEVLPEEPAVEQ